MEGLAPYVAKPLPMHPDIACWGLYGASADLRGLERNDIRAYCLLDISFPKFTVPTPTLA
jgi:hypothetical protein